MAFDPSNISLVSSLERRKFDAAIEALHAFEPNAAQLDEAARAVMKVVAKGLRAARNGSDE